MPKLNPLPLLTKELSSDLRQNMSLMAATQAAQNFKVVAAYYMYNVTKGTNTGQLPTASGSSFNVEFRDKEPNSWSGGSPPSFPFVIGDSLIQSDNCTIKIPEAGTYYFELHLEGAFNSTYEENTPSYEGDFVIRLYKNGSLFKTYDYFNNNGFYVYQQQLSAITFVSGATYNDMMTFSVNDQIYFTVYRNYTQSYATSFKGYGISNAPTNVANHFFYLLRLL